MSSPPAAQPSRQAHPRRPLNKRWLSTTRLTTALAVASFMASTIFFVVTHVVTMKSYDLSLQVQQIGLYKDCHDRADLRSASVCRKYLSADLDTLLGSGQTEDSEDARTIIHPYSVEDYLLNFRPTWA